MRRAALALIVLLPGCGWVEGERQEAADAARAETLAEVEKILADAVQRADRVAARGDRILSPMPVMTPAEEDRLRRYMSGAHVAEASTVGVRVRDDAQLDSLVAAGRLVELADSTEFWIVRRRTDAHVVPEMQALLETLGARFHERLADLNLPRYRIEVTSALRTSERQARLRRTNPNAAVGVSSHEFGATVDLSYAAFAPPAETPATVPENAPAEFQPHLERLTDLALESLSARKSRELGRVFSQVLEDAQAEGLAVVIYERQQTVYHVTVRRRDGA
jgi:hypothetical protein